MLSLGYVLGFTDRIAPSCHGSFVTGGAQERLMIARSEKLMIPHVYSFPRSGTHFIMALLKRNFYPNTDLSLDHVMGGHWLEPVGLPETDYGQLFGGHGVPEGDPPYPAIYLFRDGRDVAVSLWRTKSLQHPSWRGLSFSEFLRKPLDWVGTPGIPGEGVCVVQAWRDHLIQWGVKNAIRVRYEYLLRYPMGTLDMLAERLHVGPGEYKSVREKVGIEPHKGVAGGWRDVFSKEDELFFNLVVPTGFPGLWEG